jgi:hypothetical protein
MILNALVERLKRRSKHDIKGRHFEATLILQAVSWDLRYPLGTINLIGNGRDKAREGWSHKRLCRSSNAGDLGPDLEGLGPGGSILDGGDVVATEVEEIVDPVMGGEEALGLTR